MNTEDLILKAKKLFEENQLYEVIALLEIKILKLHNKAVLYAWRARAHNTLNEKNDALFFISKALEANDVNSFVYFIKGKIHIWQGDFSQAILACDEAIKLHADYVEAYQERGFARNAKEEYDKAIDDYTQAIRIDQSNASAYFDRGGVWYAKEEYNKAIDDYTQAIRIEQNNASAYFNRGSAWDAKKEYDKAISDYTQAIRIDQNNASAYFNRGSAWDAKKEYDKAIDDYTQAIRVELNDASAYNNRGIAWAAKKEYDKAIDDYTQAIRIDQNNALAYNSRGIAWGAKKEYDKAIDDYTHAIRIDQNYTLAYNNRGVAWRAKKEYDKAIDDYTQAIRIDKDYASAYNNRGVALDAKQEYDKAIDDYTQAIQLDQNYTLAYNNRGVARSTKKEYDKAIDDYTQAIRIDQNYALAYNNKGSAWGAKKEYDKAIDDYTQAIRIDQNFALAYYNRGFAWNAKEEYDKAIDDYTQAIEIDKNYASAYNNRGVAWRVKKEYDKAIDDYTQAIRIDKNYASAYNNRGIAWQAKQDYGKAIDDYTQAIQLDKNYASAYYNLYLILMKTNKIAQSYFHINRATYLNFNNPFQLAAAYHQNFFSPFLLRRVLNSLGQENEFHSLLETFAENDRYCKNWEGILNIIEKEYIAENKREILLGTKAFINFLMGDCIEAYRIFDVEIDTGEKYKLTLRDQYYYIRSAQDFLEPFESNLEFALKQAVDADATSAEDTYYAGMLFLLKEESNKAETYFMQSASNGFLPALYQLTGLYDKQLYDATKRNVAIKQIEQLEKTNENNNSFLNGIVPITLANSTNVLEECYVLCKHFAFYNENIEEIQLVRNLLHINYPYKRYEFWQLIQFEDDESYQRKIEHYELIDFEKLLFKAFDGYCKTTGVDSFSERISRSNQATETEEGIEADVLKHKNITYETALAKKVSDMSRIKVLAKWFPVLAKLFYLKGKLSLKEAVCLHMYSQEMAIKSGDRTIVEEINVEIQVWLSSFLTLSSPLLTKLLFKAFKFIQDGFTIERSKEDDVADYENFKTNYYLHLTFWKNSLANEYFKSKD